jgi:hypothetical protein
MFVSDKLSKVEETVTIKIYDNGYLFEVSGIDNDNDWKTTKILCDSLEEVFDLITETSFMDKT